MKKSIKLLSLFIMAIVMIFIGKETVFAADNAPKSFIAVSKDMTKNPIGLETNNISVKQIKNGRYIYCYQVFKTVPNNIEYFKTTATNDSVINNIISSGINDKTEEEFFATQAALWIYLFDNGYMKDTEYGYIAKIKNAMIKYPNEPVYSDITAILNSAKNYGKYYMEGIDITTNSVNFTLVNGKYESNLIEVNKMINDYDVIIPNNAPTGTYAMKRANGFIIYVPEASVAEGTTNFEVSVQFDKYNTYKYSAKNTNYQDMIIAYPETTIDSISMSITKEIQPEPLDPTVIKISKVDITNGKELPGATLVIKNSKGEVVKTWVSTNEPKEFKMLEVGKYTLEETIAPEGYELSTEVIEFEVKEDGLVKTVTMENKPIDKVIVKLIKVDANDHSKILSGAILVVKDSAGKEVFRCESGKDTCVIDSLKEGTYTVEEIEAPKGYKKMEEYLTFIVVKNGNDVEVVVPNTPVTTEIIEVPDTGSFTSIITYIIGGLVIIIGSVLIYKNAKKEQ